MKFLAAAVLWLAGCVSSSVVECPDGTTCPTDSRCASVTYGTGSATEVRPLCVTQEQLDACTESRCDGTCHDGVCFANECGNDLLDDNETCDLGAANGLTDLASRCSLDCQSDLTCGNQITDVAMGESCDEANSLSHDGCASACVQEQTHWYTLDQRPADNTFRRDMQVAYDGARRRIVLFGGAAPNNLDVKLHGTYEWDGQTWEQVPTLVEPPGRTLHVMTYDAARKRVVLFSGSNGSNDTWTYDGQWHAEEAPGDRPIARYAGGLVYDQRRRVAVLFGGYNNAGTLATLSDTWEWDGERWQQATPAQSPPARGQYAIGYDPARSVVVVYGGKRFDGGTVEDLADTWEYDGMTWTPRTIVGPGVRVGAAMSWDPTSRRLLLSGGSGNTETWAYDGTSWTKVENATGNGDLVTALGVTDTVRGVVHRYGGTNEGRMYEWNGTTWVRSAGDVITGPAGPEAFLYQGLVAMDNKLLAFGGVSNDAFILTGGTLRANTQVFDGDWTRTGGTEPSARFAPNMAYDSKRKQVVLVSGCTLAADAVDDGTWIFENNGWSNRAITSPVACAAAVAYDRERDEVILFGGGRANGASKVVTQDTWAWNGSAWQLRSPTMKPPATWRSVMAYDPIRKHIVLYTGVRPLNDGFGTDIQTGETWIWDGTNWSPVLNSGMPPRRYAPAIGWNPARQRLTYMHGAFRNLFTLYPDDMVAEWDGTRWNTVPSGGLTPRFGAAAAPWHDGVVLFGGSDGNTVRREMMLMRQDADVPTETCSSTDTDGDNIAGCADLDCWYACTPSCMPGMDCTSAEKLCGNGTCDPSENCAICEQDCNACSAVCGNFACDAGESDASCPGDCAVQP